MSSNLKIDKGDSIKSKTIVVLRNIGIILSVLILLQVSISIFQYSRYVKHVYDCSDMSQDCEKIFTSIGIKSYYVYGWYYDNTTECGKSFHVWLELDFGLFKLPFESTLLIFLSPTIIRDYEEIKIADSYNHSLITVWGDDIFTK